MKFKKPSYQKLQGLPVAFLWFKKNVAPLNTAYNGRQRYQVAVTLNVFLDDYKKKDYN